MKKVWLAMATAALVISVSVQAEEAAEPAPAVSPVPTVAPVMKVMKREMPPAQDLELVGKVVQVEKVQKKKDGTEVKRTMTVLDMTADGVQVNLPENKKGGVDATAFVGQDVKVTAKGFSTENKKGKKSIHIMKVIKIEPLAPAQ